MITTANDPAYNVAMANQGRTIRELVTAGYSKAHAMMKAREWYPTPAQARARAARLARKEKNGGK